MTATTSIVFFHRRGQETYEWIGQEQVAYISAFVYPSLPRKVGARFVCDKLALRVVEIDLGGCGAYVVRDRRVTGTLFVLRYRTKRVLEKIYSRLVLTAEIWGCASIERGTIPGWQNLHLPWRKSK